MQRGRRDGHHRSLPSVSTNRNEAPDIDVDFEHKRHEEVIQLIYERYGHELAPDLPVESRATGLTLGEHPLALLRPQLKALGCVDTRDIAELPPGKRIKLAGLVLMRQRPGTAKGVVFITVEDEHGTANLVVWVDIGPRDRAALLGARLMLVEAKIERESKQAEVPITHLICRTLTDRSDLLNRFKADQALHVFAAISPNQQDRHPAHPLLY
jgi:DNA polymerase III alpha subunit